MQVTVRVPSHLNTLRDCHAEYHQQKLSK
uniref:Uncharacterized protein n=1 Tax=Anguilla anguilla TaxID=7936 RepID=A0A0E9VD23_ANGAN